MKIYCFLVTFNILIFLDKNKMIHTFIISDAKEARFVYLFFAKEMTLEIKIIICRWTIMLMGGRKCISRAILSHNLYFYHVHNVTSYLCIQVTL